MKNRVMKIITGDRTDAEKHAVLLSMLERGQIKAPELAYLVKDSYVFGIEKEEEYLFTKSDDADNAFYSYLIKSMDIDRGVMILPADNDELQLLISQNPWARETIEILNSTDDRSVKPVIKRLEELEQKVSIISFFFSPQMKADFKQFKEFYEKVHRRSLTMAGSVFDALKIKNEPLAMIIGLAHTKEVTEYFEEKGVRYYVMDPAGLYGGSDWSNLSNTEFRQKRAEMPVFENERIVQFFVNGLNTRPVIGREWFRKENHFVLLVERMIKGRADFTSGGLRVDRDSLDRADTADIKFRELYVRAAVNSQNIQPGSYKKAVEAVIDHLSAIDDKNPPLTEKIKSYAGVIEAFNLDGYTVFVSPLEDVRHLNLALQKDVLQVCASLPKLSR